MLEPNKELLADDSVPRMTLAGREWPCPKMSLKQLNIAVPILVSIRADITPARMMELGSVVFMTLTRGHPALKREEFDEWPITFGELTDAVRIITEQTGMLKPTKGANGAAPAAGPLPTTSAI